MEGVSIRSIAIVMVVSFAVTVAYLRWQPNPVAVQVSALPVQRPAAPVREAAPTTPAPPPSVTSAGESPTRPAYAQTRSVDEPQAESSQEELKTLPVMLSIVKTNDWVPDVLYGGEKKVLRDVYEGIITNESDQALDLDVTETNLSTLNKINFHFQLAKGNQRHFGVSDDLPMQPGDQLSLKATAYQELTASIP